MSSVALYGASECPVCVEPLVCVKAKQTRRLVFFCRLCAVAWLTPPLPHELSEALSLDDLAPTGIELPSKEELEAAGVQDLQMLQPEEWLACLQPYF